MKLAIDKIKAVVRTLDDIVLTENMPLAALTNIGTGGRARLFVQVERISSLQELLPAIAGPWFVLGGGTNLLIADRDFEGLIIQLGSSFRKLHLSADRMFCRAGVPLSRLVKKAIQNGFPGFEELTGIPGSLGGAASMNAGAYLKEIADLTERLWMVDMAGKRRGFSRGELPASYRKSLAPVPGIITGMSFRKLPGGDPKAQAERSREIQEKRQGNHPWKARTFGSTFKNPEGTFAARLIQQAELRGYTVGGARVSPVHTNFIENTGAATSSEVLAVIKHVRETVKKKFDVELEPEVRLLGFSESELGELAPYKVNNFSKP